MTASTKTVVAIATLAVASAMSFALYLQARIWHFVD
jgi:hypothetical protein